MVSSNSLIFKDLFRIFDLSNLIVTNSPYLDSKYFFIFCLGRAVSVRKNKRVMTFKWGSVVELIGTVSLLRI